MPLDPLLERIIRIALALPHARTLALAGGCAVIVHGLVDRTTRDVDLSPSGMRARCWNCAQPSCWH